MPFTNMNKNFLVVSFLFVAASVQAADSSLSPKTSRFTCLQFFREPLDLRVMGADDLYFFFEISGGRRIDRLFQGFFRCEK
jgi:hypothetical protein